MSRDDMAKTLASALPKGLRNLMGPEQVAYITANNLIEQGYELVYTTPAVNCPTCARTHAHTTAEEAADCVKCSPGGLPRRIEGGDER